MPEPYKALVPEEAKRFTPCLYEEIGSPPRAMLSESKSGDWVRFNDLEALTAPLVAELEEARRKLKAIHEEANRGKRTLKEWGFGGEVGDALEAIRVMTLPEPTDKEGGDGK